MKVIDNTGNGPDPLEVQAIQWCAARPAVDVISLSLGSDLPSDGLDAISQAVDAAVAGGKIVVAAAGNGGDVPGSITSPGSAKKAITVGAAAEWSAPSSYPYASDGPYLAPFSSRGPTVDDRIKPDIVAPGVTIGGAQSGSASTYVVESGTSMATPYVAGVAALLRQLQPSWTQTDVRAAIEGTALDAGPPGKDNDWGAGLLDAYGAVAEADGSSGSTPFPAHQYFTGSVANNGSWSKTFTLGANDLGAPIAATVTTGGSLQCLIDLPPLGCFQYAWLPDLEAELSGPSGFVIASSTCPAGGDDCTYGRQETLHIRPTQAGTYTLAGVPRGGRGRHRWLLLDRPVHRTGRRRVGRDPPCRRSRQVGNDAVGDPVAREGHDHRARRPAPRPRGGDRHRPVDRERHRHMRDEPERQVLGDPAVRAQEDERAVRGDQPAVDRRHLSVVVEPRPRRRQQRHLDQRLATVGPATALNHRRRRGLPRSSS